MSMDNYIRRQVIMSNLTLNLTELYNKRDIMLKELKRIYKQIEKHSNFLEELERLEKEEE
jgi:hypothetical protein